jgi:hypothetical protein
MEVAATIYSNLFGTAGQLDPATITSQILQSYDKVFINFLTYMMLYVVALLSNVLALFPGRLAFIHTLTHERRAWGRA